MDSAPTFGCRTREPRSFHQTPPLTSKPQAMKETKPSAWETSHEPLQEGGCHCLFMHSRHGELSGSETWILGICTELIIIEVVRIPRSDQPVGKVLLFQRSSESIGASQKKASIWCLDFKCQSAPASLGFTLSLSYQFRLANSNLEHFSQ